MTMLLSIYNISIADSKENDDDFQLEESMDPSMEKELDPYESVNRKLYNLNHVLDRVLIKPPAKLYHTLCFSIWARQRVSNVFANLSEPRIVFNSIMQKDMKNFFISSFRFLLNSTLGLGGMFDIAAHLNIHSKDLNFSSTMIKHFNAHSGYYVVIPGIGPLTRREFVGLFFDILLDPVDLFLPAKAVYTKLSMKLIVQRESMLDITEDIEKISLDPYSTTRSLYIQKIYNQGLLKK